MFGIMIFYFSYKEQKSDVRIQRLQMRKWTTSKRKVKYE